MKNIGNFTIDDIGRIVIPGELRHMLGWQPGTQLSMYYAGSDVALLKLAKEKGPKTCDICEEADSSIMIKGYKICNSCAKYITELSSLKLVPFEAE